MNGILIDEETYSKMDEYDQNLCDTCQSYGDNYFDGEYFCGECENYKAYHKEDKNEKQ